MAENTSKVTLRNGKIEFLRFFFSMAVLIFHLGKYIIGEPSLKTLKFGLFPHGAMGVEFFFLVSGYLMAKKIFKNLQGNNESTDLTNSKDYLGFIYGKIKGFATEHTLAFIITLISFILVNNITGSEVITTVIGSIPAFFLLQMSGINIVNPNHVEWYLSSMLLVMAVIYPLCKKHYYKFTRYIAPVASIFILGYMIKTTGMLTGVSTWTGFMYKSVLRAFCCVSLGTTAFEVSRYLSEKSFTSKQRWLFTVCEIGLFAVIAFYTLITASKKYEIVILLMLFVLTFIVFSNVSYGVNIFNNKLVYHLGKISLPVYLTQLSAINFTKFFFPETSEKNMLIIAFILTFILAYLVYFSKILIDKIKKS